MEYPWYELIDSSNDISQGDIFRNCPVTFLDDAADISIDTTIGAKNKIHRRNYSYANL